MRTNTRNITAAEALHYTAPTTLVSFIADLDQHTSVCADATTTALLDMAIAALFVNVGARDGIEMLAEAEISASNPIIEKNVDLWLEAEAITAEQDETAAIEQARQGEPMTQIWQDRNSGDKWAARVEGEKVIAAFGPLMMEDAESIKADPDAWEGDSETADWLNDTTNDFRVVWPYISG